MEGTDFLRPLSPSYQQGYLRYALVFVLYFLAIKAGFYVISTYETSPALFLPSVGIAVASVIFGGYRMCWPIFLAHVLALLTQPNVPLQNVIIVSTGYAFQAAIALRVLRHFRFEPSFEKLQNIITLVLVAFTVTAVEPLLATSIIGYFGGLSVSPLLSFTRLWGAGIFSVLVFTTLAIAWHPIKGASLPLSVRERIELGTALVLLIATNYLLFWTTHPQNLGITVIFFLPAVLVWFALRFHPRWLTLAVVISSVQGIAGAIFARVNPAPLNEQLLAIEIYIGMVAAIFMVLSSVVEERRRAFRKLEEAYALTSASDKAKNEFIAILAHELRNPLAPIVSSLELLKLQPQNQRSLEAIDNAMTHMAMIRRLLDDLLDTARLSQKKVRLKRESVHLRGIVDRSVESVDEFLKSRRHTLTVSFPEDDITVYADSIRIQQVIINLLNNAGKYTEPGGTVGLRIDRIDDMVRLRVTDTGIGIDQSMLPRIFEPFKQAGSSPDHQSGLGMGLFLTKSLVSMHDGRVEVASEGRGKGSTFDVYLPLGDPPKALPVPAPLEAMPEPSDTVISRILIVDDNEAAADGLAELMRLHKYDARSTYSGTEALSIIRTFDPELVLLDLSMPDMDGFAVVEMLKNEGWSGKIVALSGYGQEEDLKRSKEAGFDHHLVKPVAAGDIIAVIAEHTGAKPLF